MHWRRTAAESSPPTSRETDASNSSATTSGRGVLFGFECGAAPAEEAAPAARSPVVETSGLVR